MNKPLSTLERSARPHAAAIARTDRPRTERPRPHAGVVRRRYETATLMPDLSVSQEVCVAPAIPLFEEATCAFARGTLIETVRGPVAVEDLVPGDYLLTEQAPEPVTWIGSTLYTPSFAGAESMLDGLIRITAEASGVMGPVTDVLIGPAARMPFRRDRLTSVIGVAQVLIPVADFVDADRILCVTPAGPVQLYHLMLPRHALIRAGGIEMESYHPGRDTARTCDPETRRLFWSLFRHVMSERGFGDPAWLRSSREAVETLMQG